MDNSFSQPTLVPPTVPVDFEAKAGTSKSDLIRATFELLTGSKITGITPAQPSPYDLAAMQSQINQMQADINKLNLRKIRRVTAHGVNNGPIVITFEDIGTTNYMVDLAYLTPNTNFDPIQWSVVVNSKTPTQVQLRLDGRTGTFDVEVTIISMEGI